MKIIKLLFKLISFIYRWVAYIFLALVILFVALYLVVIIASYILPGHKIELPNGLYLQDSRGLSNDYMLLDENENIVSGNNYISHADWQGDFVYGRAYFNKRGKKFHSFYFIYQKGDSEINALSQTGLSNALTHYGIPQWSESKAEFTHEIRNKLPSDQ